jgi:hypothetical protein
MYIYSAQSLWIVYVHQEILQEMLSASCTSDCLWQTRVPTDGTAADSVVVWVGLDNPKGQWADNWDNLPPRLTFLCWASHCFDSIGWESLFWKRRKPFFFCLGISTRCARLQKLIDLFLNKNPSNILNHYCKYKIKSPISVSSQNPSDIFCLLRIPLSVATFPLRHHPA